MCWKVLSDLSAFIPFLKLCTSLPAWSLVEEWWGAPVTCLIPFANENFIKVFEVNWGLLSDTIWSGSPMRANVQMWITWAAKGEPILPSSQDLRPGFWWILSVVCKTLSLSTYGSLSSSQPITEELFSENGTCAICAIEPSAFNLSWTKRIMHFFLLNHLS